MASHPSQVLVDVVGIKASDRGRSCEEHKVCGSVLEHDTLVRFRALQIDVEGKEETALGVFWVTDGLDRCLVGFLPRHLIRHKDDYDGKLAQVVDLLEDSESPSDRAKSHQNFGVCRAVLVEAEGPKEEASTFMALTQDNGGVQQSQDDQDEERTLERDTPKKKQKKGSNSNKRKCAPK